jgi:hypothetical protein
MQDAVKSATFVLHFYKASVSKIGEKMEETNLQSLPEKAENAEPIYYSPKKLSLVGNISAWLSWLILVVFIAITIYQFISMQNALLQQGIILEASLLLNPLAVAYFLSNLVSPLVTGIALFILMQGFSIGLNVLLEIDFNRQETAVEA